VTDKEYRELKKRVGKHLTKWQAPMGLRWWDIQIVWDRSYASNQALAAETDMNLWKYRTATITFYLPKIAELKEDVDVEKVVVHELCHVLLSPISVSMEKLNEPYQVDIMEFNTELVAQALGWTYQAGRDAK
jgi:hypothetical protein